MGAVAEMLRRRERREPRTRLSWWGVLWAVPIGVVFFAGDRIIPRTGLRWLDAIVWAGYGLLWMATVLLAERTVRRTAGGPAWGVTRPLGWAAFFTILFLVAQVVPAGQIWAGVPAASASLVFWVGHFVAARKATPARH